MIRPALLAVLAITFAPLSSFAQFGGMGGVGGGMGGIQQVPEERTVKVELVGGQSVSGVLRLGSFLVDSDVGQYEISPGKVKVIRLSRLLEIPGAGDQSIPYAHESMQGIVVTTSDKEISGVVRVPYWKLEFDFGSLTLKPSKLKTITFTAEPEKKLGSTRDVGAPGASKGIGASTTVEGESCPVIPDSTRRLS